MSELRSNEQRRVSDRMIAAWRLCVEHKHEPQPGLGQFDWPRVLTRALDEIDRLQAEVSQLRAKIEAVIERAEARGTASLPAGVTLSGCSPLAAMISPSELRAALAEPTQEDRS